MERWKEEEVVAKSDDDCEKHVSDHGILLSIKLREGVHKGKSTPSPAWKLEEEGEVGFVGTSRKCVSARKLGANLWEMENLIPVAGTRRRSGRRRRHPDGGDVGGGVDLRRLGSADGLQTADNLRNLVTAPLIQHRKSNERKNFALQSTSPAAYSSSMEVTPYNPTISPCSLLNLKGKIGDARYSLRTSTELLKVLNHIFTLEEQHASNIVLVKSLKKDLEGAKAYIQELILERKEYYGKVGDLVSQVEEDILIRKNKEEDRLKTAVGSLREELDDERLLRRKCESLYRNLGKELSQTRATLSNTLKDLENERKSSSLLEDFCDEFAKEIRQYGKETGTGNCNHEVDGLMLHISESWLEKRLQMRDVDLNKKAALASTLKAEIISFLQDRRVNNIKDENEHHRDRILHRQSLESLHLNGTVSAPCDIEDDDSISSDLHCFELNMNKTNAVSHDQLKSPCEAYRSGIHAKSSSINAKHKGKELSNIIDLQTVANRGDGTAIKKSTNSSSVYCYGSNVDDIGDSSMMNHFPVKNLLENSSVNCKVHKYNYHGEISHSKMSQPLGNVQFESSPVQQWRCRTTAADIEIPECSWKLPERMKVNTLKAKLLEARSEGRNARLKAMNRRRW